jgi:O-antigen/teichoic acid export membrane protein
MVKRILTNSASNVTVLLMKFAVTFVMAPITVRALGNYDYGIWEIIIGVVGYMGLLDLGLRPAVTRYIARYRAMEDTEGVRKVYSTSLLSMGVAGFLAFLALAVWAVVAPELLAQDGANPTRYIFFLLIIGVQVLIAFPGYVAEGILEGFQRFTLKNNITIITTIIGVSVLYYLLQRGYGLLTLAMVNTIGKSVKICIYWILLRLPRHGEFRFRGEDASWNSFKELLSFGYKNFIQSIASIIFNRTAPIMIGGFLGPVAVAFYMIPANLVVHIRNLLWSITQVFMPLFSHLDAQGDRVKLRQLLTVASRYVVGLILPLLVGVWFLGVPFLGRWMGPEYAEGGKTVLYILTLGYGLNILNPFHNRFLTGIGHQGVLAIIKSAMAVGHILLSLVLVRDFGKEGIAMAVLIPAILFEPIILFYTCKYAGITMWRYARDVFGPVILPIGLFAFSLWILSNQILLNTYVAILSVGLASSVIYVIAFALLGIDQVEQRFILSKVKARISTGFTLTR